MKVKSEEKDRKKKKRDVKVTAFLEKTTTFLKGLSSTYSSHPDPPFLTDLTIFHTLPLLTSFLLQSSLKLSRSKVVAAF
jgi:hypothetical protein